MEQARATPSPPLLYKRVRRGNRRPLPCRGRDPADLMGLNKIANASLEFDLSPEHVLSGSPRCRMSPRILEDLTQFRRWREEESSKSVH